MCCIDMGQDGSELNGAMARRGLALLVAAAGLVVGCADDPVRGSAAATTTTAVARTTRPVPTTTLPDLGASAGLAASIRQFREDEAVDRIQVELVRGLDGGPPTAVRSVRLRWPGFAAVEPTVHDVTVVAGQRVDVPTPLGQVVCTTPTTPSFGAGTVDIVLADGTSVVAPLLADAQTALDNVWGKGCVRKRLVDRVGLAYAGWVRTDPGGVPTASGTLVVTRRDTAEPVTVTGVDGSVLLFVNWTTAPPPLPPGERELAVPVVVAGAGRCDGHALSDSKRTYIFQVQVRVGDEEPVGVDVPVAEADRPLLNQVIVDTCGTDHRR